jgi:hypothetical protein
LVLALETAKVSLFAADSTTAAEMVRAPDGYPKRTGTERHGSQEIFSTAKLIARSVPPVLSRERTGTRWFTRTKKAN